MSLERPLESLSDDDLLRGLVDLLHRSRRTESDLVAHIGEVDTRHLYAREACPSMFVYCTNVLHLSEAEAYLRITVARAAREHPMLLEMLGDGRLHLAGIERLAPHLTLDSRDILLSRAVHRSKRQIEVMLAEWAPRPDVPDRVRKLPDRPTPELREEGEAPTLELRPDGVAPEPPAALGLDGVARDGYPPARPAPPSPALVQPLSPGRFKVQFTAGAELHGKLERLRALLRHEVPDGDLARIIETAVSEKLERLEARRFAQTRSPRKRKTQSDPAPSRRYVAARVRRIVYRRDQGQCRFVDAQGRRCPERHHLEYHHRRPFALGGGHDPENICLMCRAHNRLMAEIDYGTAKMSRHGPVGKRRGIARWGTRSVRTESAG